MHKVTDQSIIAGYLEDSSNLTGGSAEGLYLPSDEKEAREVLLECAAKKEPLTFSAAQTGTTGGCIPFGGNILSVQKLTKIINIDPVKKTALIQSGVTLEELAKACAPYGLFYAPDPTEKSATIGGNVNTNASGGRSYRFGSTRDHILGLNVLLTNGESLELKRKVSPARGLKNAAGYYSRSGMEPIDLFIGQEGTLGFISEIEVNLLPKMADTFELVAFFKTEEVALGFVEAAKKSDDRSINFFEYFDPNTLQMLGRSYPHIPRAREAAVYIEQELTERNGNYLEEWEKLLSAHDSSLEEAWIGSDAKQQALLRQFRHAIPEHINELFKEHHLVKMATDIAVPEGRFREMFNYYNDQLKAESLKLFFIKFGHIGDNHLHVNLLPKNEAEKATARELILRFVRKAIELGGTVSAEHGIGKIKRDYLLEMYGERGIERMRRTKKKYDPQGVLGRGNIFTLK
ncbi:MAG: FAD-binding oxidoreductase [Candidatus Margulisbacteria bacterium]|nr:FAD-binding oxidoreductase [Candidatus Margulisiibacteriota bacterium]MBU1616849.1 FAD-binding oxidoreductase [Candidatus Margulisiibacteriota bacterium]